MDRSEEQSRLRFNPISFKEVASAVLSLILMGLLVVAAWQAYKYIGQKPLSYEIGGVTREIDPYDRARDLLNVFFPLFGAVVTFWLGAAIEGRRADVSQKAADTARLAQLQSESVARQAEEDKERIRQISDNTLERIGAKVRAQRQEQVRSIGLESMSSGASEATDSALKAILEDIEQGRELLSQENLP